MKASRTSDCSAPRGCSGVWHTHHHGPYKGHKHPHRGVKGPHPGARGKPHPHKGHPGVGGRLNTAYSDKYSQAGRPDLAQERKNVNMAPPYSSVARPDITDRALPVNRGIHAQNTTLPAYPNVGPSAATTFI